MVVDSSRVVGQAASVDLLIEDLAVQAGPWVAGPRAIWDRAEGRGFR